MRNDCITGTSFRKLLAESLGHLKQKLRSARTCQQLLNRNGLLLREVRKTMTWKSVQPIVEHVTKLYEKGKTLSKSAFAALSQRLGRKVGIAKWSAVIEPPAKTVLS